MKSLTVKRALLTASAVALMVGLAGAVRVGQAAMNGLTPLEELGKAIFFDTSLSNPAGQSCAACHAPEVGFTGPLSEINAAGSVYEGAVPGRFGNRKPPASSYAGRSPNLFYNMGDEVWVGGMFWDGRATGETLGDPLAEQAQGPFLNPLEQNLASPAEVCQKIREGMYNILFLQVWGPGSLDCEVDVAGTYERIARSIAAYERSAEVNPYSSKFDRWRMGRARLTAMERRGMRLFFGKAKCAACHVPPEFTDFTYDNLGFPKNPANPFYTQPPEFNPDGMNFIDYGLGGFLKAAGHLSEVYEKEMGKMKVPTLRNVDRRPYREFVKAYGHNGYFKSLKDVVHFYNTRDVLPACEITMNPKPGMNCWPAPEVAENVNTDELGNLGLSDKEEDALVEFMKTLSDGWAGGR
jgi:cytochrome c peroxidase